MMILVFNLDYLSSASGYFFTPVVCHAELVEAGIFRLKPAFANTLTSSVQADSLLK